jgi:hypothetical protein
MQHPIWPHALCVMLMVMAADLHMAISTAMARRLMTGSAGTACCWLPRPSSCRPALPEANHLRNVLQHAMVAGMVQQAPQLWLCSSSMSMLSDGCVN